MSTISAGLSNTTAIVVTGDTTGNLVLRSNGTTTAVIIDTNQNATFSNSVTVNGTINANISGNGASLTNINASNISSGTISNAFTTADSSNSASTIVTRDANGSFGANVVSAFSFSGDGSSINNVNASNISSGTIDNARTTATSANGAATIILRDAGGSFSAGAITAESVSGNGVALTAINASNISSGTLDNARTTAASANGASTIVLRDADGSFAGNVITGTSGSFTAVSGNGVALTAINASNISSGTLDNARTNANSSNVAATIVLRGASGEFDAGAINAASFTGNGAAISGINASNVSSGTIDNARTTAASSNGASTIVARDSNGSFTANVGTFTNLSANTITLTSGTISSEPINATDIANKLYVDEVAEGLKAKPAVELATTGNLTATYDNGPNDDGVGATLTATTNGAFPEIDGVTLTSTTLGQNGVLVKNQTAGLQNGRYNLTTVGDGSNPWVLTRCALCDESDEIPGAYVFVKDGTLYAGTGWVQVVTDPATFQIGVDTIFVFQFSGAGTYTAGTGLTLSDGTVFSISNTAVTAAQYGNDGAVSQITVNAQGQITAASNVSINASSISVGTLANGRTTAASANGASTIVARDSDGSFSANVVTAGTGSFTAVSGNGIALTAINASNVSSGTLSAQYGGTGSANLTADNVILGNGASTVKVVAPGTSNNVLTSNGTTWISQAPAAGGVASITGTANQIIASASTGAITLSTPQSINTASSVQFGSFGVGTAASGTTGEIRATNNVTAFYSDERLKTKTGDIENALDKVCQIETLLYHANETAVALGYDASIQEVGVTAQSVQKVQPEIVVSAPIDDKYLTVRYEKLVPLLIEAIKELKAEIDELKG